MKRFKPIYILVINALFCIFIAPGTVIAHWSRNEMFVPIQASVMISVLVYYATLYGAAVIYNKWYLNKYGLY